MKLLFYPAIEKEGLQAIRAAAPTLQIVNAANEQSAQVEIIDADGFFGKINPELLRASTRLQWVQAPTSSLGQYIFPELIEHPCVLTSMRGLCTDAIADHVLGYLLCFARNFHLYIRNQTQARWRPVGREDWQPDLTTGVHTLTEWDRSHRELSEATLGIVGLGYAGSAIAHRSLAFGMRVVAVDPVPTQTPAGVAQVWGTDHLNDLLAESDFVVIAVPQTPQTERMFRREQLQQMKPTAYLINVSRGVVVDLAGLTASLHAGEIAGAGLDVFEVEPLPGDHPLWSMENVIITPHVAGYSAALPERFWSMAVENVQRFAQGKPLCSVVNKALRF